MEELNERVNQLHRTIQDLVILGAPGGGAQELRSFKQALNHLPRFSGEAGGVFRDHVMAFMDWIQLEEIQDEGRKKKALVFSLTGSARARIRSAGINSTPFNTCQTVGDYINYLYSIFEPDSEKNIARLEFASYKQQANEDIGSYLAVKYDLYQVAYPQGDGQAAPPFSLLFSHAVQGIYSKVVKRLVVRAAPTNEEELRAACLEAVSSERFSYENGFSESTSLDGLTSVTRGNQRRFREIQRNSTSGDPVPMEIDSLNIQGKCRVCHRPGHFARECPQKGKNSIKKDQAGPADPKLNKTQIQPGKEQRTCYHCGKVGHLKKDCFKLKKGINAVQIPEEDLDEFFCALEDSFLA